MSDGPREEEHGFDHVEGTSSGYVLVCRCGWRSAPSVSAEAAGEQWDQHLDEADT